jgi:hypothetical protein
LIDNWLGAVAENCAAMRASGRNWVAVTAANTRGSATGKFKTLAITAVAPGSPALAAATALASARASAAVPAAASVKVSATTPVKASAMALPTTPDATSVSASGAATRGNSGTTVAASGSFFAASAARVLSRAFSVEPKSRASPLAEFALSRWIDGVFSIWGALTGGGLVITLDMVTGSVLGA